MQVESASPRYSLRLHLDQGVSEEAILRVTKYEKVIHSKEGDLKGAKAHRYVSYAIAGSRTVIGGLEDADRIRIGKHILSYIIQKKK